MKQPKWITAIEATDHWDEGYWVKRGWDREARVKATSVIDTVHAHESGSGEKRLSIGGIAHAGARGISRVEVRMDEGPWLAAALREPLSPTTWVIWRWEVPFQPGDHAFAV